MKNRYEALIVLNTQGKDDAVKDIVDRLESEFQKEGAQIEQVQKMDKRPFARVANKKNSSGFYLNVIFEAAPAALAPLRAKFALSADVFRVSFTNAAAVVADKAEKK